MNILSFSPALSLSLSLSLSLPLPLSDDMMFLGTTPANRPDSPEYVPAQHAQFDANYRSLHDEQLLREAEIEEDEGRTTRYCQLYLLIV